MKFLSKIAGYRLARRPESGRKYSRRQNIINTVRYANDVIPFYNGVYDKFLAMEQNLTDEEFFKAFSLLPTFSKDTLRFQSIHSDAHVFLQSYRHSFELSGWKHGENVVVFGAPDVFFTRDHKENEKTLSRYFGLTVIPFKDITKKSVCTLLDTLRKKKANMLVTSPSALHRISEIMHHEKFLPYEKLRHINVSGEFFLDCSKSYCQIMFPDSDIQSTYSGHDFCNIAHQKNLRGFDYDVFSDHLYLEQGAHNTVLLTHYKLRARPLIRYRLDDVGRLINNEDGSQTITCLEGNNKDYVVGTDNYCYYASFFNNVINDVNSALNTPIIHFSLCHCEDEENNFMQVRLVLSKKEKQRKVKLAVLEKLDSIFSNYKHISVKFSEQLEHDFTRKFRIINKNVNLEIMHEEHFQGKGIIL